MLLCQKPPITDERHGRLSVTKADTLNMTNGRFLSMISIPRGVLSSLRLRYPPMKHRSGILTF